MQPSWLFKSCIPEKLSPADNANSSVISRSIQSPSHHYGDLWVSRCLDQEKQFPAWLFEQSTLESLSALSSSFRHYILFNLSLAINVFGFYTLRPPMWSISLFKHISTDPEQSVVYLHDVNFFHIDSHFVHTCLVHSWCAGVPLHTIHGFHILLLLFSSELSV